MISRVTSDAPISAHSAGGWLMKRSVRPYLSLAVALVLAVVFTMNSFVSASTPIGKVGPVLAQDCTGSLTIRGGSVSVNGNAVQTGATILTGSIVATSSDGHALIDFGPVGKLELGTGTTVTITCVGGIVEVRSNCARTYVKVRGGRVDVTQPKVETLDAGKDKKYDNAIEATAAPGTDWYVDCQGRKPVGMFVGPGLGGVLALIGIGTGVAVGISEGGPDERPPSTSPTR